jgi:hypothetical protein
MAQKGRKRFKNVEQKAKKLTRCHHHSKPVFEHESCSNFSSKHGTTENKNCGNCKYSF